MSKKSIISKSKINEQNDIERVVPNNVEQKSLFQEHKLRHKRDHKVVTQNYKVWIFLCIQYSVLHGHHDKKWRRGLNDNE